MDQITAIFLGATSLVPFAFSLKFNNLYHQKNRDFYRSWAIGFLIYGVINVIDSFLDIYGPVNPFLGPFTTVISFASFTFILTGIGQLVRQARMFFYLSLTVPGIAILLLLLGYSFSTVETLSGVIYLGFTVVLYYLRIRCKLDLEVVDLGWLIIVLANIGYSFNQVSLVMTVIFSLLGKTIAYLWMSQPRFVAFTDQIENFVGSGVPRSERDLGTITVLESSSNKMIDLNWITKSFGDVMLADSRKILVVTSNLFSDSDLSNSGLLDIPNIHVVRMDASLAHNQESLQPKILGISDNIDSLKVSMLEIIESIIENDVQASFIVYNLSTLIHTYGWRRIFTLMISTLPKLKQAKIHTQIVITPDSHENIHEVNKIILLANRVMQIAPS